MGLDEKEYALYPSKMDETTRIREMQSSPVDLLLDGGVYHLAPS
jgi:hypothetical protein